MEYVKINTLEEWNRMMEHLEMIGISSNTPMRLTDPKYMDYVLGNKFYPVCITSLPNIKYYSTVNVPSSSKFISVEEFISRSSVVKKLEISDNFDPKKVKNKTVCDDLVTDGEGFLVPGEGLNAFYNADLGACYYGGIGIYADCALLGSPKITRPLPFYRKESETKETSVFFGAEIEFHNLRDRLRDFSEFRQANRRDENSFLYFCTDGSLSSGVEVNTNPFTKEWYFKYGFEWIANLVNDAAKFGAIANDGSGIHIHISKTIGDSNVKKIRSLVTDNRSIFERIGGRYQTGYCTYSYDNNKYTAVNVTPPKTIELRFPRSSTNPEEVLGRIESAMALAEYASNTTATEVSISGFLKFIESSEYQFLKKFKI